VILVETLTPSATASIVLPRASSATAQTRIGLASTQSSLLSALRYFLVLLAIALLSFGIYYNRQIAALSLRELVNLTPHHLLLLVAVVGVHKIVSATPMWRSIPGLRFRQAMVANEVYLGCANATFGGFAVGTGVKVSLLRSKGVREPDIVASILWTSIATPCCVWIFAGGFSVVRILRGTAHGGEGLVLLAIGGFSLVGLFGSLAVKRRLVRTGHLPSNQQGSQRSSQTQVVFSKLASSAPKWIRRHLERIRSCDIESRITGRGLAVLRCRGLSMAVSSLAAQISLCAVMVTSIMVVNHAEPVSWIEVAGTFALARAVGSFAPVPGGVGVLDVGLVSGFVRLGIPTSTAVAAVGIFRTLTFLLPIVCGFLVLACTHQLHRNRSGAVLRHPTNLSNSTLRSVLPEVNEPFVPALGNSLWLQT
jgi:uncharacterized membrane protein YbhN (UPF0104 family)